MSLYRAESLITVVRGTVKCRLDSVGLHKFRRDGGGGRGRGEGVAYNWKENVRCAMESEMRIRN
jgi:hypothetical protein